MFALTFPRGRDEAASWTSLFGFEANDSMTQRWIDVTSEIEYAAAPLNPTKTGGQADIYQAKLSGLEVAVKVVRHVELDEEKKGSLMKKARKELELWSSLRHRNILPFKGICFFPGNDPHDSIFSLVSPWMRNGTIKEYVREHTTTNRVSLMIGVTKGLVYLHDKGIVHGDLKPANIFISDEGLAVLADFGLSRLDELDLLFSPNAQGITSSTNPRGTLNYMAPEFFAVIAAKANSATDVWALGCVILDVVYGTTPYAYCANGPRIMHCLMREKLPLEYTTREGQTSESPTLGSPAHTPANGYETFHHNLRKALLDSTADTSDEEAEAQRVDIQIDHLCGLWLTMSSCWKILPNQRPPSSLILIQLQSYAGPEISGSLANYLSLFIDDFTCLDGLFSAGSQSSGPSSSNMDSELTDRSSSALAFARWRIRDKINRELWRDQEPLLIKGFLIMQSKAKNVLGNQRLLSNETVRVE